MMEVYSLKERHMRSALAVVSTLLILASACSSDYGRATSPSTYPPPVTPSRLAAGAATPPLIQSIKIVASDSILVVGDSTRSPSSGSTRPDGRSRRCATSPSRTATRSASSCRPTGSSRRSTAPSVHSARRSRRASGSTAHAHHLEALRHERSAAPARFDFLTTLLPETFVPSRSSPPPTVSSISPSRTPAWTSRCSGRTSSDARSARTSTGRGFVAFSGVLADFPIGDQFETMARSAARSPRPASGRETDAGRSRWIRS